MLISENKRVVRIPAKINLSLAVTGRRETLHTLDMIVVSADIYDEVEFVPNVSETMEIIACSKLPNFDAQRFCAPIYETVRKLNEKLGTAKGNFLINKRIPLCAGLGGSSAVIAGIARLYELMFQSRLDNEFLLTLGSDVPYMVKSGAARVRGVGEDVQKITHADLYIVALIAEGGVNSTDAYKLFDKSSVPISREIPIDVESALKLLRNDLEDAAFELNPLVAQAKIALSSAGAKRVIMSGSGSAVCAVFDNRDDAIKLVNDLDADNILLLKTVEN